MRTVNLSRQLSKPMVIYHINSPTPARCLLHSSPTRSQVLSRFNWRIIVTLYISISLKTDKHSLSDLVGIALALFSHLPYSSIVLRASNLSALELLVSCSSSPSSVYQYLISIQLIMSRTPPNCSLVLFDCPYWVRVRLGVPSFQFGVMIITFTHTSALGKSNSRLQQSCIISI